MSIVYNIFYNLTKLFARCFFSMRIVHPERMVEEGPLILAVNHSSFLTHRWRGFVHVARSIIWRARICSSGLSSDLSFPR